MGKTPKKAVPGGDERNLYVRRLKATSKGCDTNLTVKQRESDNSNRTAKRTEVQKGLAVPVTKVFKSKLRSPARTKSHRGMKNPTRSQAATAKEEKKNLASSATFESQDTEHIPTMLAESEESAVQLKVSIRKKDAATTVDGNSAKTEEDVRASDDLNSSRKETAIVSTEDENAALRMENENADSGTETSADRERSDAKLENGTGSSETMKDEVERTKVEKEEEKGEEKGEEMEEEIDEREDEAEVALHVSDDVSSKLDDDQAQVTKSSDDSGKRTNEYASNDERKEETSEEARETTRKFEGPKSTADCSEIVVESTTSEISDSGRCTQSDKEDETKESGGGGGCGANDAPSLVSYDSSIMLKDVQIKLNDCLKENSKLFESSNVEESEEPRRHAMDVSFGKSLRNISGRSTINRLRYITVREHRFSPNSSLFVNTSSASFDPDDSRSGKLEALERPSDPADSIIRNGSPLERKRKIPESASASTKKLKTDASSLLDASMEILKTVRKPVEVSTPNSRGYNFQSDRFNCKGYSDEKLTMDTTQVEPKKWCVVM